MNFDNAKYQGWTIVKIGRQMAWRLHNFLPLVDSMYKQIEQNHKTSHGRLLLNLSAISYFDSTMVSLILRSIRLTGDEKNSLVIGDESTRDILSLLGIDRLVDIYDSEQAWAEDHGFAD